MQPDILSSPLDIPPRARDEIEVLTELEGNAFVDHDFPPTNEALGEGVAKAAAIGWHRMAEAMPEGALFIDGQLPGDLVPGASKVLDDTWFAGALAAVATRADLLLRLFVSVDNEEAGMLSLRFFKHGAWRTVLIDTMLPCIADGSPAFCRASSGLELWASVLLKGYAKLHGSYAQLAKGDAGEALVDLTGGALTRERMPALSGNEEEDAKLIEALWGLMRETEREGGLLALETEAGGEDREGLAAVVVEVPGLRSGQRVGNI